VTGSNLRLGLGMIVVGTPLLLGFLYVVGKCATLRSVGARRVGRDEAPVVSKFFISRTSVASRYR
jgi:hypothetical protein